MFCKKLEKKGVRMMKCRLEQARKLLEIDSACGGAIVINPERWVGDCFIYCE
jgi:hypothetical protein